MNKLQKEYLDSEFKIEIRKSKGRLGSMQIYEFSHEAELLVAIASMTKQLISKKILDSEMIKEAVEMGVKQANGKF